MATTTTRETETTKDMAASVHPTINDQMTRVQLRLLKERLEREREQAKSTLNQGRNSNEVLEEKYNDLKEAAYQRKELLKRLKHEQQLSHQLLRPKSNPIEDTTSRHRHRRTESQPQLTGSKRNGEQRQHIPARLPPLDHAPVPPPLAPPVLPAVSAYHVPYQVVQPYQMMSAPVFGQSPQQPANNSRSDMYEMMMMQNAQMHQMIMQQLMLNSIQPRNTPVNSSNSSGREKLLSLDLDDIRKLLKTSSDRDRRAPPSHPPPLPFHPDYNRFNVPYATPCGSPPLLSTYQRPPEAIPVTHVLRNVQTATHPTPDVSHLQAQYRQQQNENEEVPT